MVLLLPLLTLLLHQPHPVLPGATKANVYDLYTYLFSSTIPYNIQARPVSDTDNTLEVYMVFSLLSLVEVDDKAQSLTVSAELSLTWTDDFLSWTTSSYGGVTSITIQQKNIWKPDVMVANSMTKHDQLGYDELPVRLLSTGSLVWSPSLIITTSCDITVTYYPFDSQACYIEFTTAQSTSSEIDVHFDQTNPIQVDEFQEDGTWVLEAYSAALDTTSNGKSQIKFAILLTRRTIFYIMNLILPMVFLSSTAPVVFLLPPSSGEKMGTSLTVLLAIAVYLTIVSEYLPDTSLSTSILAIYLMIMLGISVISVLMSAIVLQVYAKDQVPGAPPPRGKFITGFMRLVRILEFKNGCRKKVTPEAEGLGKTSNVTGRATGPSDTKQPTNMKTFLEDPIPPNDQNTTGDPTTWTEVAAGLDWACFLLVTATIILTTILVFLQLIIGSVVNKPSIS